MKISFSKRLATAAAAVIAGYAQQVIPQMESLTDRTMRMSESEVATYVNSRLDEGLRPVEHDRMNVLILGRGSIVLPIMERRIEEVLSSPNPKERFRGVAVEPDEFVLETAADIAWAGNVYAIDAFNKLLAIDEKRFGRFVPNIFYSAVANGLVNPFLLAYHGLALGNAALDMRILAWIEAEAEPQALGYGTPAPPRSPKYTRWWADAMVKRYGHAPNEVDWYSDPIASRINRRFADSLHDEVLRLAAAQAKGPAK